MSEDTGKQRLKKGDRLGKYEVMEYLASGGMATVYKAQDTELGRVVALKILSARLARQPKMLDRFRREARAAAGLRHENIVELYEFGESDGAPFLAMEYVPGVDLQNYVEKRKKLPPDEARQIILQATRALAHAHAQQIVHRDVKPSNFLLTRKDGRLVVKLTDMGLAMGPGDEECRLTRVGTTVGTVDYMAPEQARDSGSADIRSDLYSLGCTFYHILAGTAPFARGTMAERLLQHLQDEVPDIRALNKEVPAGYVAILQRMLAKKPEDRYQTPAELLRDLEDPDGAPRRATTRAAAGAILETMKRARPAAAESPKGPAPPRPPRREPKGRPDSSGVIAARDREPQRDRDRDRDRDREPPREPQRDRARKRGQSSGATWVFLAVGAGGVLVLAALAVLLATRGGVLPKKDEPAPPPATLPTPIVTNPEPDGKSPPPPPTTPVTPAPGVAATLGMGPDRPTLPALLPGAAAPDRAALAREFYGPFAEFPRPPEGAPVLVMRRGAAPESGAVRSLAEALALAPPGASVIEVQDRGPIFVGNLPPLEGRDVYLRAAPGYRPLLAWEAPRVADKGRGPPVLLAHRKGRLVVEGFDLVVKWADAQADAPACLFQLAGGELQLRDCTFSLAGKHPHGLLLARLLGAGVPGTAAPAVRLRLSRCYARGTDLGAFAVQDTSAEVLIDDCVLANSEPPLLRVRCRDDDEVKLRVVRSSLVTGQELLRIDPAGKEPPRVHALVWDSILARNEPASPEGDLVRITGKADADNLRWRAVSSVYAGWKKLLATATKAIDAGDLPAWHAQWPVKGGDRSLPGTWPNVPPAQLEDLPAGAFLPYDTPVAFAASGGDGALGAVVGRLPAPPEAWLARSYDRPAPPPLAAFDPGVPPIDEAADGLYHGERIELPVRADLGVLLMSRLQGKPLGPRVVFHIAGAGEHPCTPLRVKDVGELVLYFEPPRDGQAEPLTLTPDPKAVLGRPALIEVERGNLTLVGARVRYENSKSAIVPPYLVKVTGGNLLLWRCRLTGPLAKAPDAFQSLIFLGGPARGPLECRLGACVLLSGKNVLQTTGAEVQLSARQNVVLALDDAVQLDLAGLSASARFDCRLDGNTWALRRALLALRIGLGLPERPDAVLIGATANYFTDPFGGAPPQSALLRLPDHLFSEGLVRWQGKGNAFDRRLGAYYVVLGHDKAGRQTLEDWLQVWGRVGETDALVVDPGPAAAKAPLSPDAPQLERLALPRLVRPVPGNPVPGADLAKLGLQKKK